MKVLSFTIPASQDKTILVQEDILPSFYPFLHRHEEIQLTMIIKGEGTLVVGKNMHAFTKNQIFLIGANMPHVFKNDEVLSEDGSEIGTHALTVFFNPKGKLTSFFSLPELKNVNTFFESNSSGFQIPTERFEEFSTRILQIKDAVGIEQLIYFFQLLQSICSLDNIAPLTTNIESKDFSDKEGVRISTIYNYVMQHYHREITLEEIAAAAFMTPPAFCRYFKKHTGVTFVTFLNDVRINEACKKLLGGKYESVAEVAYHTGFNSITNFNRVFKTSVGKSPREYAAEFFRKVS
jgi:AraC-like DNA-binding protein